MYSFYAMLSRMKNIDRWALMRNTKTENICEHSHDVAVLMQDKAQLDALMKQGAENASRVAGRTLGKAMKKLGFVQV